MTFSKRHNYSGFQGLGGMTIKRHHEKNFWSGGTVPHPDCGGGYMNLSICCNALNYAILLDGNF